MEQVESVRSVRAPESIGGVLPWAMLGVVWLVMSGVLLVPQVGGPLATFIQDELQISRAQIGLFGSAFGAGTLLTLVPGGHLADRIGVRRQLLFGPAIVGAGLAVGSLAPSFALVVLALFISGLGYGTCGPAIGKAIAGWFPSGLRATAMAIMQTSMSVGGTVAGLGLPLIAVSSGWRTATGLVGLTVVGLAVTCFLAYREAPCDLALPPAPGKHGLRVVLADPSVRLAVLSCVFFSFVQLSFSGYLVLYLKEYANIEIAAGGSLLALSWIFGIAGRILLSFVSDRAFGGRRKELLALNGLACSFVALAMIFAPQLSWPALVALIAVSGFIASGWTGLIIVLIQELSGRHAVGVGTGAGLIACYVGFLVGPPIFGLLVDVSHSYVVGWIFLAICGVLAMATALPVKERP